MTEKITKTYDIKVAEKATDGGQIVISTVDPDRDNDRVFPGGAKVDNYLRNPIVQWAHNYSDPWATIGRTDKLETNEVNVVVDFSLRPAANEQDPQNVILLLWDGDWVRTASIGFDPRVKQKAYAENEFGGYDFTSWELLEWSLVPIPANQNALRLALEAKASTDFSWSKIGDISYQLKSGHLSEDAVKKLIQSNPTHHPVIKAQSDAPNYRPAEDGAEATCATCRFLEDGLCTRYEFEPDPSSVCDSWEMVEPMIEPEMEMLAWVRQLDVEGDNGPQSVLATFYLDRVDIPEDAEKMTINAQGDIEMVPHPDAGSTVIWREVNFSPPVKVFDDDWGDDAIYAMSSAKAENDDDLLGWLKDDGLEIKNLSMILVHLPINQEIKTRAYKAGLDVCKLTAKSFGLVKNQIKAKTPALVSTKAGRVISAANETKLKGVRQKIDEASADLGDVLAAVENVTEQNSIDEQLVAEALAGFDELIEKLGGVLL